MAPPVLDGISILDFTQTLAGSLAGMVLADNGADVVKVEPPGGDPMRAVPAWLMWNRGKKSIVLDLRTKDGRASAQALARRADVVVESFRPGEAESMDIGYEALAAANPRLVYCSITAFGSRGAHRGLPAYDGVVEAKAGGYLEIQNWVTPGTPTYRVRPNPSYACANLAVQGIAAALLVREQTGQGQRVETSLYQGLSCYDSFSAIPRQVELGIMPGVGTPERRPGGFAHTGLTYLVCRCKDGQWIQMTCNTPRLFRTWMETIGLGEVYQDARYRNAPYGAMVEADRLELRRLILGKMLERPLEEWLDLFIKENVAGERFLTTQQCMDHPQVLHNQAVIEVDDPTVGRMKQIGPLVRFAGTPPVVRGPAPRLGEHTGDLMGLVKGGGGTPPQPSPTHSTGSGQASRTPFDRLRAGSGEGAGKGVGGPLAGLLVLDFASFLAAPFGMSLVADLGARVIKVEPPSGDEFRSRSQGRGRTFQGKESLVVDLKTPEGRKIAHALIRRADGLMHNMRGGADARTGIDYETARKLNPEIVYLYAGSYGSSGPGAGRGAFHPTAGALGGGVMRQLGRGNEPPANDEPMTMEAIIRQSEAMLTANEGSPDVSAALAVGTAMVLALLARARTGKGQYLETSMLTSNGYMSSEDFLRYPGRPALPELDRHLRGLHALHRLYRTAAGWVFLTCPTEGEWQAFCRAADIERVASDARFASADARRLNDDQLIAVLGGVFQQRTADQWEHILTPKGVACVRADRQSLADFLLRDPSVRENGFVVETSHPARGKMMRQGPAVRFSKTPGRAEPAPLFGENTPAILAELGIPREEVASLKTRGIVAWE